jgi:hypothetical protein
MFWVYILENPRGWFYLGQTDDLTVRVANHNRTDVGLASFVASLGPGNSSGPKRIQLGHQLLPASDKSKP